MASKYVLFTNLNWVRIGDIRMNAHAVLLEHDDDMGGPGCRGFGTSATWEVFSLGLKSIEYQLSDRTGRNLLPDGEGILPVQPQILLKLDGFVLELVTHARHRPLEIQTYDSRSILEVWEDLQDRVPEYWPGPAIPLVSPQNTHVVRALLRERRGETDEEASCEPHALPPYEDDGRGIGVLQGRCSRCRGSGRLGPGQGVGPKDKCPSHRGCGGSGRLRVTPSASS